MRSSLFGDEMFNLWKPEISPFYCDFFFSFLFPLNLWCFSPVNVSVTLKHMLTQDCAKDANGCSASLLLLLTAEYIALLL